jgi:predicted metal-dependent hydrolase
MPPEQERARYEQGIAHFNRQDFFEAHEAWEEAWNGTAGRRHEFYQGLVQMAVSLVHLQRRNRLGVQRVFERARARWAGLPDLYMGLDLRTFERRMEEALGDALLAPPGAAIDTDPSRFFRLRLEYDPFEDPREERDD